MDPVLIGILLLIPAMQVAVVQLTQLIADCGIRTPENFPAGTWSI
jgi:hypothetical protein